MANEEIKSLLKNIKIDTEKLFLLFWSNEELAELKYAVDFLENRLQGMMRATLSNLEWYQNEGWKKFLEEENDFNG